MAPIGQAIKGLERCLTFPNYNTNTQIYTNDTNITSVIIGMMKKSNEICLILDNIRSVLNVGAIFRTADALLIDKIYLSGITLTPIDRFVRKRADFHKTALGAEDSVPYEHVESIEALLLKLRKNGFQIIAVEQSPKSVDYKKAKIRKPVALIFGSETEGISKQVLNLCETIIEIPMKGKKESLNVSVSAGIVLFRLLDN